MRTVFCVSMSLAMFACGGAKPSVTAPTAVAPSAQTHTRLTKSDPSNDRPDHTLKRSVVTEAVAQGLGVFLQRVDLDEQPVRVDGRFHGFRIAALHDEHFWSHVDLKPGDVVTSVNGFPIERPQQAQTAFDSLEVASELRVAYERNGTPRELVYAIIDDR